jgi:hypothetical protein
MDDQLVLSRAKLRSHRSTILSALLLGSSRHAPIASNFAPALSSNIGASDASCAQSITDRAADSSHACRKGLQNALEESHSNLLFNQS